MKRNNYNYITMPRNPNMTTSSDLFENNMSCFFYEKDETNDNDIKDDIDDKNVVCGGYYLPTVGMTNCKLNEHNELKRDHATIYFRILDRYNVPYAVFAGSSIGLLRNSRTIPWSDGYSVVVLNSDLTLLFEIFPILRKNGFKIVKNKNKFTNEYTNGGCSINSQIHKFTHGNQPDDYDHQDQDQDHKCSGFACDVYYSYVDKNGFLRNSGLWGLYHVKKLHIRDVMPFRRRMFDGLPLPFFNNVNLEVYKTYGNTDEAVIKTKTHFQTGSSKYASWRSAYDEFENRKSNAIQNTMHKIYNNNNNNNNNQNIIKSVANKNNVMKIMDNKYTKNQVELLSEIGEKEIGGFMFFQLILLYSMRRALSFTFQML